MFKNCQNVLINQKCPPCPKVSKIPFHVHGLPDIVFTAKKNKNKNEGQFCFNSPGLPVVTYRGDCFS